MARNAFTGPFSFADLVVITHLRHGQRFGLEGYGEVPDARIVWNILYANRGLLKAGKIRRTSDGKFRVVTEQEVMP